MKTRTMVVLLVAVGAGLSGMACSADDGGNAAQIQANESGAAGQSQAGPSGQAGANPMGQEGNGMSGPNPPYQQGEEWDCSPTIECPFFKMTSEGKFENGQTDLEAARCYLTGLRDRKVGKYQFAMDENFSSYEFTRYVVTVLNDGTAVSSNLHMIDSWGNQTGPDHVELKGKAYFDACLKLEPGPELVKCVQEVSMGAGNGSPQCPVSGT
jgi:hypothetical protein